MHDPSLRKPASAVLLALISASHAAAQTCGDLVSLGSPTVRAEDVSGDGSTIVGFGRRNDGTFNGYRWTAERGEERWNQLTGVSVGSTVVLATDHVGRRYGFSRSTVATGIEYRLWEEGVGETPLPGLWLEAISGDGETVVGRTHVPGIGGTGPATVWTDATGVVDLPGPGPHPAAALDVSYDGSVIVGFVSLGSGLNDPAHAVRWVQGGQPEFLLPGVMESSVAVGVSADGGTIVGTYWTASGSQRGFRWTAATGWTDLGLAGALPFVPVDVSGDGRYAVGRGGTTEPTRLELATGAFETLGLLDGNYASAYGVSFDGTVVVGQAGILGGPSRRAFRWNEGGGIGDSYCSPAVVNSTGCAAFLSLGGSRSVASNEVFLRANHVPPGATTFFLASRVQASVFPVPNSQGALCLGGAIGRFVGPGQVGTAGPVGVVELRVDLNVLPQPTMSVPGLPGETWSFQAWHRDANPGPTSNFSDGVSVTLE